MANKLPVHSRTPRAANSARKSVPAAYLIPGLPLAKLMEQTARHMHALGHVEGLVPAQWAAIRYFDTATPPSNTAIGLARHQGMAFGPVSRSVRTLISRNFLRKGGSAGPGRSEAIELTGTGKQLLVRDPLILVAQVLDKLPPGERVALANAFEAIIREISSRDRS